MRQLSIMDPSHDQSILSSLCGGDPSMNDFHQKPIRKKTIMHLRACGVAFAKIIWGLL